MPQLNECRSLCPSGFYEDTANKQCLPCAANCAQCASDSATSCTACISNFYLHAHSCVDTCPSGTQISGTRCESTCPAGQYSAPSGCTGKHLSILTQLVTKSVPAAREAAQAIVPSALIITTSCSRAVAPPVWPPVRAASGSTTPPSLVEIVRPIAPAARPQACSAPPVRAASCCRLERVCPPASLGITYKTESVYSAT